MITKIYKILLANKWSYKDVDQSHNKKMGISKCFVKDKYYCEIYTESLGFSVHLYGGKFQNGYYPTPVDILKDVDLEDLRKKLNN